MAYSTEICMETCKKFPQQRLMASQKFLSMWKVRGRLCSGDEESQRRSRNREKGIASPLHKPGEAISSSLAKGMQSPSP